MGSSVRESAVSVCGARRVAVLSVQSCACGKRSISPHTRDSSSSAACPTLARATIVCVEVVYVKLKARGGPKGSAGRQRVDLYVAGFFQACRVPSPVCIYDTV
jgi:hypothetical protein